MCHNYKNMVTLNQRTRQLPGILLEISYLGPKIRLIEKSIAFTISVRNLEIPDPFQIPDL